jgi:thioredoxin reductase
MFFHRGAGDGGHRAIPMSTVTSNVHASTYYQSSMGGMQGERLHQIVVFEIREDGNTQYLTMTLRSLYNYVVRTITEGCREANKKKQQQQQMEQQLQQHQQRLNNRNTMLMYGVLVHGSHFLIVTSSLKKMTKRTATAATGSTIKMRKT